jgi:Flp pilus assembly protein TadD
MISIGYGDARRSLQGVRAILIASFLVTACSTTTPAPESSKNNDGQGRVTQTLRTADAMRAGGDLAAAALLYRRASALDPSKPEPLIGLAEATLAMGGTSEAADAYRQALKLAPNRGDLHRELGRVLIAMNAPDEAIGHLEQAHKASPEDVKTVIALGVALDLAARHAEAQDVYANGLKQFPGNPSLRNNLALSMALDGAYPEAAWTLEQMAEEPQANARIRQNLALVYALDGRMDRAEAMARRDLSPAQIEAHLAYFALLRTLSGRDLAEAVFGGPDSAARVSAAVAARPRPVAIVETVRPEPAAVPSAGTAGEVVPLQTIEVAPSPAIPEPGGDGEAPAAQGGVQAVAPVEAVAMPEAVGESPPRAEVGRQGEPAVVDTAVTVAALPAPATEPASTVATAEDAPPSSAPASEPSEETVATAQQTKQPAPTPPQSARQSLDGTRRLGGLAFVEPKTGSVPPAPASPRDGHGATEWAREAASRLSGAWNRFEAKVVAPIASGDVSALVSKGKWTQDPDEEITQALDDVFGSGDSSFAPDVPAGGQGGHR